MCGVVLEVVVITGVGCRLCVVCLRGSTAPGECVVVFSIRGVGDRADLGRVGVVAAGAAASIAGDCIGHRRTALSLWGLLPCVCVRPVSCFGVLSVLVFVMLASFSSWLHSFILVFVRLPVSWTSSSVCVSTACGRPSTVAGPSAAGAFAVSADGVALWCWGGSFRRGVHPCRRVVTVLVPYRLHSRLSSSLS